MLCPGRVSQFTQYMTYLRVILVMELQSVWHSKIFDEVIIFMVGIQTIHVLNVILENYLGYEMYVFVNSDQILSCFITLDLSNT